MTETQVIDVESTEVTEEPISVDLPVEMHSEHPVKTKEERMMEMQRFDEIKKMIKRKKRYYKSNLFQIRKLESN